MMGLGLTAGLGIGLLGAGLTLQVQPQGGTQAAAGPTGDGRAHLVVLGRGQGAGRGTSLGFSRGEPPAIRGGQEATWSALCSIDPWPHLSPLQSLPLLPSAPSLFPTAHCSWPLP